MCLLLDVTELFFVFRKFFFQKKTVIYIGAATGVFYGWFGQTGYLEKWNKAYCPITIFFVAWHQLSVCKMDHGNILHRRFFSIPAVVLDRCPVRLCEKFRDFIGARPSLLTSRALVHKNMCYDFSKSWWRLSYAASVWLKHQWDTCAFIFPRLCLRCVNWESSTAISV